MVNFEEMLANLSPKQIALARAFQFNGITSYTQAIKAFYYNQQSRITKWKTQLPVRFSKEDLRLAIKLGYARGAGVNGRYTSCTGTKHDHERLIKVVINKTEYGIFVNANISDAQLRYYVDNQISDSAKASG